MRRLLPAALFCFWSLPAYAGAWLMPEGEGLAITQLTRFTSGTYWDEEGERQPQAGYGKWELQPYVEYGLTKKLTVGGSVYLQRTTQAGSSNHGIADPEFFARAMLWKGERQLVSIQPLIKLPSRFEHPDSNPRGGSKSTDAELSLLYGRNLSWLSDRDYADLRIGYRWRSQDLSPQYRADAAVGLNPTGSWFVIPAVRLIQAAEVDATVFQQNGDLDYDLLKAELTVAYELSGGDWVQATYFDHLSGRQTGDGHGISVGYAVRF